MSRWVNCVLLTRFHSLFMSLIRANDGGSCAPKEWSCWLRSDMAGRFQQSSWRKAEHYFFLRSLCFTVEEEGCSFALWRIDEVSCRAAVLLINNLSLLCASSGSLLVFLGGPHFVIGSQSQSKGIFWICRGVHKTRIVSSKSIMESKTNIFEWIIDQEFHLWNYFGLN